MIVAFGKKNRAIGKGNTIPWKQKSDMKRFAILTKGTIVVMGRKTFESMDSKPLPKRLNIVISSTLKQKDYSPSEVVIASSVTKARYLIEDAQLIGAYEDVYIIGGESIYEAFIPDTQRVYATEIQTVVQDPDARFTPMLEEFDLSVKKEQKANEKKGDQFDYTYLTYDRKKES